MNTATKPDTRYRQCCRFGDGVDVDVPIPGTSGMGRFPRVVAYAWHSRHGWLFRNLSEVVARVGAVAVPRDGHAPVAEGTIIAMSGRRFRAHIDADGAFSLSVVRLERVAIELRDEDLVPIDADDAVSGIRPRLEASNLPVVRQPSTGH